MKTPAVFYHIGFIDLICDALFHLRSARESNDHYIIHRNARASISAISLSLECFANAILSYPDISSQLFTEMEKLPALAKIDAALLMSDIDYQIDYGDHRTQKMKELIKVRNQFVHPKETRIKTEVGLPVDGQDHWLVPMTLDGEMHKELKIPTCPMFWNADSAHQTLNSALLFYNKIFKQIHQRHNSILKMLLNRLEIKQNNMMPNTHGGYDTELRLASVAGLDVTCFIELCELNETSTPS